MTDPLDQAWQRINALKSVAETVNTEAWRRGWASALDCALSIITDLGGMDPELRQRPLDPPPSMRVRGGMSDE